MGVRIRCGLLMRSFGEGLAGAFLGITARLSWLVPAAEEKENGGFAPPQLVKKGRIVRSFLLS